VTTRLVLVSLDWGRAKDPSLSLGHASLLARLAVEPSAQVTPLSFAVNAPTFRKESVLAAILDATGGRAAFVAIGAFIWNEPVVRWLLPALRGTGFTGRIILGGPQVSFSPIGVDALYPDADVFIRGYAEDALATFVASGGALLPLGVTLRSADHSAHSARPDLAALPSPLLTGVLRPGAFLRWEAQRGCPYSCSFCQHRESGSRMRFGVLPQGRVLRELEVIASSSVTDLAVLDPVFNMNPHAEAILRTLADLGYRGRVSLQCRFELLTASFLDACSRLDVHLEFGLQTIHEREMRAIGRLNNLVKVDAAVAMLRASGVPFEVSLIYGLPEQTLDSFRASVDWCHQRSVSVVRAFPLMLLRGTALDQGRERWKLVESNDAIPVVTQSSSFTHAEWLRMHKLAAELEVATKPRAKGLERIQPSLVFAPR
jgi:radical SAM superfamily enzyme YgiQ (UPF0313 family)